MSILPVQKVRISVLSVQQLDLTFHFSFFFVCSPSESLLDVSLHYSVWLVRQPRIDIWSNYMDVHCLFPYVSQVASKRQYLSPFLLAPS
jgi:uncharacterized membrane protein